MDLWIRSQDRMSLTKVFDLEINCDNEVIADDGCPIGVYKSKERALEVLDEIQKYILLPNVDNSAYVYEIPEE